MILPKGEMVCDGGHLANVDGANGWCVATSDLTKAHLQQMLDANVSLLPESPNDKLSNMCRKKEARQQGARKVSDHNHQSLLEEIACREMVDYKEDANDIMDDLDSEAEEVNAGHKEKDDKSKDDGK